MNAIVTQRSVPLIPVATDLLPARNRADLYRSLVAMALNRQSKSNLITVDIDGIERRSLFIPPLMAAKVQVIAEEHQLSFQEAFAALCATALDEVRKQRTVNAGLALTISAPFKRAKPDQLKFFQGLWVGLEQNKIVLAEASTGIGKGRALVAAGILSAEAKKTPVIIAAPTLAVVSQLWSEMEILRKEGLGKKLKIAFFPGASEFINEIALKEFLSLHDKDPELSQWVEKGGKPLKSNTPLNRALRQQGFDLRWLMEDAKTLAVNMDPMAFALKSDDECTALAKLDEIRLYAQQADIIFCTHTMLAYSHWLKWILLPEPHVLLIDEAHQLEQNIARIHTNSVSLYSLRYRLQRYQAMGRTGHTVAAKAIKSISELFSISNQLNKTDRDSLSLHDHDHNLSDLKKGLKETNSLLKSKLLNEVERLPGDRETLRRVYESLENRTNDRCYIEFSPDRRFPSFMAGKGNIDYIFGSLWKTAQGGAVLASATLYIQDNFGNTKCDYIANLLAIPMSRVHNPPPIIAKWITEIPTLHLPSSEKATKLARPNKANRRSSQKAEAEWIKAVAEEIAPFLKKTKGGSLLLTTSYWQINELLRQLNNEGIGQKRLIAQEREIKFGVTETRFRKAYEAGIRPVLLGLGVAWTGINLCDETVDPELDRLLDNLIIAVCPVGLNRTNSFMHRVERIGTDPIIKEALMHLKQGLGRLVRNENQIDKHIIFLDGRLWTDWHGMKVFQDSALRMLDIYKKRVIF